MRRRTWVVGLVVLGAIGWYLFRPELLFVKTKVNESLPAEVAAQTVDAAAADAVPGVLLQGQFRSVAHETKGTATVHELGAVARVGRDRRSAGSVPDRCVGPLARRARARGRRCV